MNKTIDCVIVTYNRLSLLKECVQAVLDQDYPVKKIYIINNNSTDNTREYLKFLQKKYINIIPVNLNKNVGGAGGFNIGLKYFLNKSESEYVWIMDDDTIPSRTALKNMVNKIQFPSNLGFLCSNVRWKDMTPAKMNIPEVTGDWNRLASKGLVKVKSASFVSILFPRSVVKKVGYPITDFFIWGDDIEYTLRITKGGFNGYLSNDSIVEHKIKNNIGTNIISEKEPTRIKRYYFANRNIIYTQRKLESKKELTKALINKAIFEPIKIIKYAKKDKIYRLRTSIRGTFKGLVFHPNVEKYKK